MSLEMSFAPAEPTIYVRPTQAGPDTWVVHEVQEALGAPLCVYVNSMVITGKEPVIVDTGTAGNRRQWLEDVFGLVEPRDVRYVFLSHDDVDHTGNLAQVMMLCPNATLVASWALVERFSNAFRFPLERCLWLNDGDRLDAADRRFRIVRPPVWDSPTTRGLLDERTGIFWGVDSFPTPCTNQLATTVDELDPEFWRDGMAMFTHNALAPWLSLVDHARYTRHVDRIQALGITTIASGHTPLITRRSIDQAFAITRNLPLIPAPPSPDQAALDGILRAIGVAA